MPSRFILSGVFELVAGATSREAERTGPSPSRRRPRLGLGKGGRRRWTILGAEFVQPGVEM
jgi:hypothetical protein